MYITSDLFGRSSSHNHGDHAPSTLWNTMADPPHAAGLGKRKRHDAAEEGPSTCMHHQRASPASRRSHAHSSSFGDSNRSHPYSSYSASSTYTASERRPVKQAKRLSPKATLVKSASHLMDIEPERPAILSRPDAHQHPVTDLRPCHACKSAPRRKKDLENYLDCRRCDGRTCYICARQCFGACGKAVCNKCIVEVGENGDPWCLDCYSRNINS
ncbi:hypothetical protein JI435_165380 [Parastagonospora nodorum SN15]|uniref:Uncharacterized protein n=1 Tax=Phaeosphaeria nodorum (strain SN15 / ATCC MYA-4574 / FGSC 10173) TaxID=321614 RepID=A0A7U2F3E6_PHANO|nr:hypothetical protein JI435_165380 [Parastagonospora nodorum SN15]